MRVKDKEIEEAEIEMRVKTTWKPFDEMNMPSGQNKNKTTFAHCLVREIVDETHEKKNTVNWQNTHDYSDDY